jgi:hypothetical protein
LNHQRALRRFDLKIGISFALFCLAASALAGGPAAVLAVTYNSNTQVSPAAVTIVPTGTVQLIATVQPGCSPVKTCPPLAGTLTWDDGDVGGSFSVLQCTFLSSDNLSVGKCATTYTGPGVPELVGILASYSGSSAYSSSSGGSYVEVVGSGSSSTISTTSSRPSTSAGSAGPSVLEMATVVGVVAAVLALVVFLILRKPKSPELTPPQGVQVTLYSIISA